MGLHKIQYQQANWKNVLSLKVPNKKVMTRYPTGQTEKQFLSLFEGYRTSAPHIILLRSVSKKMWLKRFTTLME